MINKKEVIEKALNTLYDIFNRVKNTYDKEIIIANAQLIKSIAYAYKILTINEMKN